MTSEHIWSCKIGGQIDELPHGSDAPMRQAIKKAFFELTGYHAEFTFSGWAAELTEGERAVVENRLPDPAKVRAELETKTEQGD